MDIQQYIHKKEQDVRVVKLTPDIVSMRDQLSAVIDKLMKPLVAKGILYNQNPATMDPFSALSALRTLKPDNRWAAQTLTLIATLCRAMGYLLCHSIAVALGTLREIKDSTKKNYISLAMDPAFKSVLREAEHMIHSPGYVSHPKMDMLRTEIIQHFTQARDRDFDTRVIVFVTFRGVVDEIVQCLNEHKPLLKATRFVGQGKDKGGGKGFAQKDQIEVCLMLIQVF